MDTAPIGNTLWVKGCEAVLGRRSSWSILDASAPHQVVAEQWSFIEGELQVEPDMSRHGYDDDDDFDIVDADGWNQYDSYAMRRAPQQPSIHMTQQMTTKVAPAYDGRTSFFAFEDAIDDWCDITELEPEKRGPALQNRLEGEAQQYKRLLDREMLRDPNDGVNYFKRFLRPHFIKGAKNVFLYRFMQFMKYNGGTMDIQKWMTRFQLTGNRLIESWMDLLPDLLTTSPEAILYVQRQRQDHEADQAEGAQVAAATPGTDPHVNVPWTDDHSLVAFRQLNENRRQQQRLAFPLGDNLLALIFVSLAGLSQDQRNTLTSIMTHHGRTLDQYNVQELRDLFLEMFCTIKTAVDNPMMQPSGIGQRRSFLIRRSRPLLGRRWWRRRRRIPGCFRRCFLGLWWRWLHMVSEKVPR